MIPLSALIVQEKRVKTARLDSAKRAKEISFSSAALGEKIEVNTIYGPVQLNIPAGTSSHTEFRLKDKGVLHPTRKTKGDHFILIKIKVPKKLTREEKELLEKWKKISD